MRYKIVSTIVAAGIRSPFDHGDSRARIRICWHTICSIEGETSIQFFDQRPGVFFMKIFGRFFSLITFLGGMSALSTLALPNEPLDQIRLRVENAQDQGAIFKAPVSLRRAENELQRAEELSEAKPRRPLALEHAIENAEYRAEELSLVLSELKSSNYRIDEETAIRRVQQRRRFSNPGLIEQEVASARPPESE
jgi:hypothetical protein